MPDEIDFPPVLPLSRGHARASCFQIAISRFESFRPGQAVPRSENGSRVKGERPAIGGLSRFRHRSPSPQFREMRGQFVESLQPRPRIFPFSGDFGQRPGATATAWRTRHSF